jgi:hypothetical protein
MSIFDFLTRVLFDVEPEPTGQFELTPTSPRMSKVSVFFSRANASLPLK